MEQQAITTQQEQAVNAALRSRLGEDLFKSWFKDYALTFDPSGDLIMLLPGRFQVDYVKNNYTQHVEAAIQQVFNSALRVRYQARNTTSAALRPAADPEQPDFFAPALHEVPLKDEVHLLSVAPFTLTTRGHQTELTYQNVSGMNVTLTAPEKYGIITAGDYDFVVMMMSELTERANKWRSQMKQWTEGGGKGPQPEKPSRKFRPTVKDIENFRRQKFGGRQYQEVEAMLDRLANTSCKVERTGRHYRRAGTFNFLGGYEVMSRSKTGVVLEMEVTIPDWVYEGIVRPGTPTVKQMHPDYVLIEKPMGKFLYRLALIEANQSSATVPLAEIHRRSPSIQNLKEFNRELVAYIKVLADLRGTEEQFPDYDFDIVGPNRSRSLEIRHRSQ